MTIRIAVLSDLCSTKASAQFREFAELVFLRTVHYLNDFIRPDLLCITGDTRGLSPRQIQEIRSYAEKLKMPWIAAPSAIAGTHSAPLELNGFRIEPASGESSKSCRRILLHAEPFDRNSKISADQSILNILPAGSEVPSQDKGSLFFEAPPLDRPPYRFAVLTVSDSGEVSAEMEQYLLPPGLMDTHVHTRLAYCSENMDLEATLKLAQLWGLKKIAFTEHSGHLYFTREQYWSKENPWFLEGLSCPEQTVRTGEYLSLFADIARERCFMGMEIDVDRHGRHVLRPEIRNQLEIRIGAVHALSEKEPKARDEQFFRIASSLIESGIDILAHPFRVYSWDGVGEKPLAMFEKIVDLLKRNRVAAEINFHHNRPDPVFTKLCIDAGVKIALGSDSHNLYEVGYFQPHLRFLKELGYRDSDLPGILWKF